MRVWEHTLWTLFTTGITGVLDITPFYAESGGQIGDRGDITGPVGVFKVQDTRRPLKGLIVHYGDISEGHMRVGDSVQASVNGAASRRYHA